MRVSDTKDFFHNGTVFEGNGTQLSPILSLAAVDHVVECGKGILLVIQVPVQHG